MPASATSMQEVFDNYVNYLRAEQNASENTVRIYTGDLLGNYAVGEEKGFFQFLKQKGVRSLRDVDRDALREYVGWLMELGIAKRSIARKLSAIRSFYRYLMREDMVESAPISLSRGRGKRMDSFSLKLDKPIPEFLNLDEINKLLEVPDLTNPLGLRDKAFLELLYASGLRVGELVSLDIHSVNLETREIRVIGKGSKERVTLMGVPAREAIKNYIDNARPQLSGKKTTNALFLNNDGGRLTARSVERILADLAQRAGIKKNVHPHMLRHTFATHLLNGGADLRVVQELLGHADLSSTQIYTHVTKEQARKIYLASHPMAKEKGDNDDDSKQGAKIT